MKNNLFPTAKEGWYYIGYALGFLIIFSILDLQFFQVLSFAFVIFFLFVFRNPERELPNFEAKSVLSPVDGKVLSIDTLSQDDTYGYMLTVDTTYKDVGVLRAPMNASLREVFKQNGTRLSMKNKLAKFTNEHISIVFEDVDTNKVKLVHTLKQSLCGVSVDVQEKQSLVQSARYGIMINGLTYIYLPENFRLNLVLGEELSASKSLVGYFS